MCVLVLFWLSNNTKVAKNAIFCCFFFSQCRIRRWVRWETKQTFNGQLYQ